MNLIIVESPTKAKTIAKFLGKDYKVESSFGHIKDLPKSEMGIDIQNGFEPKYIVPTKAKKLVSSLKSLAKKSDEVILASDEDREGEAIAWHLAKALDLNETKTKRIVFHEITKDAILEAMKNPRTINQDMVDAQQARRVLDRLVGYELSPFLWKKVAKGLSAGRVQSVATKMIVEREKEIKAFVSEDYASLSAELSQKTNKETFLAEMVKIDGKAFNKLSLKKEEANNIQESLKKEIFKVVKIDYKTSNKNPNPPFTTSTLQQSANRHLGFSAKQTMTVAQKLYEEGYITYMRTDSLNLSPKFLNEAKEKIENDFGKDYLASGGRVFKNKSKNAQEAHEAIRPTEVKNSPEKMDDILEKNQARLYKLIWQRAVASQMSAAKIASTSIDSEASAEKKYTFRAIGQQISFPGYLKVWPEKTKEQELPAVKEGEELKLIKLNVVDHATTPPARYSDASLVKEMEKYGVGRPSTYAPTISTIIARNYAERDENKRLKPSDIAFVVTDLLSSHFNKIIDYGFTAKMENDLDQIAAGEKTWQPVIADFYQDFHENLSKKYEEINKKDIMPEEKSDEKCDKCGASMIIKTGRYGKFLACSAFPDCRNIKKMNNGGTTFEKKEADPKLAELEKKHQGEKCEKCGSEMKVKTGKYGPFLACSGYPKCKNIKNISDNENAVTCPICQKGKIVKKFSKRGAFYACSNYPNCKNAYWGQPTGKKCPDCGGLMINETKSGKIKCSNKDCGKE